MRVRPFDTADEGAVVALWQAAGLLVNPLNDPREDIRFCRESGHGELLVGEDGGSIVATVMVGHDGHRGWVYYLATAPERRRRGLGRRMMASAERWLTQRGVPKVELIVRDSNTRVIGFYQRLGYVFEPRALLAKRLDGVPVLSGGAMNDQPVVITYLEMTERPKLPQIIPAAQPLALLRCHEPTVSFYRYLYDAVGRQWVWSDRKVLTDDELEAAIRHPLVEIFVLYVDGVPAGYFELDRRPAPDIDLAYFGIMPEFLGRRLGPYLLAQAIDEAWRHGPARLTVNTCTLDHPKALPMYQRFGFRAYQREQVPAHWQRGVEVGLEP
jgi:ribosomal protein S18 acetylase RimI-like enzyme